METAVIKYRTRARTIMTQCLPKSRIDRRRTRMDSVSLMCDTDEEEESTSEESSDEEERSSTSDDEEEQTPANKTTESSDEDNVIRRKRLRTSSSNKLINSDSSSDSEIYSNPVRKIKGNSRRISIQDEEEDSGEEKTSVTNFDVKNGKVSQTEKELTIARKRKRQLELKRLSQKKRSHCTTSGSCELFKESDEEPSSLFQVESISDTEWENDSLKDFIVVDDKESHVTTSGQPESPKSILAKHLPNLLIHDLYSHFRRVVKALLINAIDANFLNSLYEGSRKKKYAQEMLKSLNHLDDRCIGPRLVNLRTNSRWKNRYQERVDCYPNLHVKEHPGFKTSCQACELQRTCRFTVILSGQLYNGKSLEQDSFMSNDKQEKNSVQVTSATHTASSLQSSIGSYRGEGR
ncbi:coiled-coil domain-containing protein 82 isoform X2 [Heptranchias perlo]|uniref:coiled-coil domain-containing protein 82 isoform X2 n=1 Tax=Heptranchias perlo TaxID=212740 RepID=UPI0035598DA4